MKKIQLFLALLGFLTIGQVATAQYPGSTFADPIVISSLPYFEVDATTCGFGDNYTTLDIACTGNFMSGDEIIYSFNSPVALSNMEVSLRNISDNFSGIFVVDDTTSTGNCVGSATGTGNNDRVIGGMSFAANTTYYIMSRPEKLYRFFRTRQEYLIFV